MGEVTEIKGVSLLGLAAQGDKAELRFVLGHIVHQRVKEPLCMLGSHDDPVTDVRFGKTGKHRGEINDELAVGMGDDSEVRVGALRYFGLDLQAYFLFLFHDSLCL